MLVICEVCHGEATEKGCPNCMAQDLAHLRGFFEFFGIDVERDLYAQNNGTESH